MRLVQIEQAAATSHATVRAMAESSSIWMYCTVRSMTKFVESAETLKSGPAMASVRDVDAPSEKVSIAPASPTSNNGESGCDFITAGGGVRKRPTNCAAPK